MAKDPQQGALVLPPTRDGRTPSGMKTAIAGAGNRITRTHELGERVFLFIEANVKKSGHEVTDDGVLYTEGLKVLDLFELADGPGKRLLSALRQSYRTESGEPPLTNGDETAGEGLDVALDASMVALTPAELADLRGDPSAAMDDARFDHVVLVFDNGARGLWPDDWAGTGQSRAPIGGTMRHPGSTKAGDVGQVVELLDAKSGETIDRWTPEREAERLLVLEGAAVADEERQEALAEYEALFAKDGAGEELTPAEAIRYGELRTRFEEEARADREVHDGIVAGRDESPDDPAEPDTVPDDAGDPNEPGAPFAGDPPDPEIEADAEDGTNGGTELAYLPGPDDFAFVDRSVADVTAAAKTLTDRTDVLRKMKAEEQGRGRGLKPRKGVLEGLEKRAGELFADHGSIDAPDLPDVPGGFEPPEGAEADDFGPGPDELG